MNRRDILKGLGIGAAASAGAVSLPLIAESVPAIQIDRAAEGKQNKLRPSTSHDPYHIHSAAGYPNSGLPGTARYWNIKVDDLVAKHHQLDLFLLNHWIATTLHKNRGMQVTTYEEIRNEEQAATWVRGVVSISSERLEEYYAETNRIFNEYTYPSVEGVQQYSPMYSQLMDEAAIFKHLPERVIFHVYYLNQKLKQDFLEDADIELFKKLNVV